MPIKGDLDLMWKNYPNGFAHDPSLTDTEDHDRIEKLNEKLRIEIGGKVNNPDFKNLCAIRLSYSLNRSGNKIPGDKILNWYKKPYKVALGGDGYFYGRGVVETMHYLQETYGKPDLEFDGPFASALSENDVIPAKLKSKKGIILFLVKEWVDAQGHVTLWDGAKCSDNPYFHKAQKVMLWEVVQPQAGRSVRIHNLNDAIRIIARPIAQDSGQ